MNQLSAKQIIMIKTMQNFDERNLPKQVVQYKEILDILTLLQDYLVKSKVKIPSHLVHIDTLITKIIFHSNTIFHLLNGIDLEVTPLNFKTKILDIPSLCVLLRAQLENYLIFDFIYCQPQNKEETMFRYNNWLYAGYISRKDIPAYSEPAKKMKDSDLVEIERLKQLIQNSKYFLTLTDKQQKNLIKNGNDRLSKSWVNIMLASGFGPRIPDTLYKFISSYAHSSSGSIFNISELKAGYTPNHELANLIVSFSKIIISKFIVRFKDQIKTVEIKYNMLNQDQILTIEFYSAMLDKGSKYKIF